MAQATFALPADKVLVAGEPMLAHRAMAAYLADQRAWSQLNMMR